MIEKKPRHLMPKLVCALFANDPWTQTGIYTLNCAQASRRIKEGRREGEREEEERQGNPPMQCQSSGALPTTRTTLRWRRTLICHIIDSTAMFDCKLCMVRSVLLHMPRLDSSKWQSCSSSPDPAASVLTFCHEYLHAFGGSH